MANVYIDMILGWALAVAGLLSIAGSVGYNYTNVGLVEAGAFGAVVAAGIGILMYLAAPKKANGRRRGYYTLASWVIIILSVLEVLGYLGVMPLVIPPFAYGIAMAIVGLAVAFGPRATRAQGQMAGNP